MARKKRDLATGFEQVSSDTTETINNESFNEIETAVKKAVKNDIENNIVNDSKNDINNDIKNNINEDSKKIIQGALGIDESKVDENDKLAKLLSGKTENKRKPQYIYLDSDIVKLLDKYGGVKKKGRSSKKSELVNEILRQFFKERGDL